MSRSKKTKGQTAFEFVIMMAFAVLLGMVFLASISRLLYDANEERRVAALNDIGYAIQDEVILATQVEDGYKRTFEIPEKADFFTYTILSQSTGVTLSSGPVKISYIIPEVTGIFSKGTNTIEKSGTVTIS